MEGSDSEASETDDEEGDEGAAPQKRQVFFCSRTHSQLSQFVSELRRTPYAETLSVAAIAGRKVHSGSIYADVILLVSMMPLNACSCHYC